MQRVNEKKNTFVAENAGRSHFFCNLRPISKRRDARVVEEARLESVYTSKGYRGFESPSLRKTDKQENEKQQINIISNLIN